MAILVTRPATASVRKTSNISFPKDSPGPARTGASNMGPEQPPAGELQPPPPRCTRRGPLRRCVAVVDPPPPAPIPEHHRLGPCDTNSPCDKTGPCQTRPAASVRHVRHNEARLGPTEPCTECSRILLSSGRAWGAYYRVAAGTARIPKKTRRPRRTLVAGLAPADWRPSQSAPLSFADVRHPVSPVLPELSMRHCGPPQSPGSASQRYLLLTLRGLASSITWPCMSVSRSGASSMCKRLREFLCRADRWRVIEGRACAWDRRAARQRRASCWSTPPQPACVGAAEGGSLGGGGGVPTAPQKGRVGGRGGGVGGPWGWTPLRHHHDSSVYVYCPPGQAPAVLEAFRPSRRCTGLRWGDSRSPSTPQTPPKKIRADLRDKDACDGVNDTSRLPHVMVAQGPGRARWHHPAASAIAPLRRVHFTAPPCPAPPRLHLRRWRCTSPGSHR